MASADDKNITPFDQHLVQADTFIEGFSLPGESIEQVRAKRFLRRLMRKYPHGLPGQTKDDYRRFCCQWFGITPRYFDRAWEHVIAFTGAIEYRTTGPRGPHQS